MATINKSLKNASLADSLDANSQDVINVQKIALGGSGALAVIHLSPGGTPTGDADGIRMGTDIVFHRSAANEVTLNGTSVPTLIMSGGPIKNVQDPVADQDVVTLRYATDNFLPLSTTGIGDLADVAFVGSTPNVVLFSSDGVSFDDATLAEAGIQPAGGTYDAGTNTPDLDVAPSASIKAGTTYFVSAPGTFFATAVTTGTVLVANQDTPTLEAHWDIIPTVTVPGGLADLSDVDTAAGTQNFVMAAPSSGTGNYAGRLLVAGDIPSLAASKITSGTLVHEQGGLEADVSAFGGLLLISSGATSEIKANLAAVTDPGVSDDATAGYSKLSPWLNTAAGTLWFCINPSAGTAVWKNATPTVTDGTSFIWESAWLTATAYTANDVVSNGGSSYICTSNHTSAGPTEPGVGGSWATVWDLVAAKGDTGANGSNGADGAPIVWESAWVTATGYAALDMVSNGGSSYICTSGHTSAASTEPGVGGSWTAVWDLAAQKGDTGSTGAAGTSFTWESAWADVTVYQANDVVRNDGSSYVCILGHTSSTSDEPGVGGSWTTYWSLMAQKGDTGATGAAGASFIWENGWLTATAYTANDAVAHNGSSYMCIFGHTSSAADEPGVGGSWATYWDLMADGGSPLSPEGAWTTATGYAARDIVENDGSSYVCTSNHTSGASTEPGVGGSWTTVWDLMASKGDTGAAGTDTMAETYTQVAHGLSVDDAVILVAGTWVLIDGDVPAHALYLAGIITATTTDTLTVRHRGKVTGLTGLTAGDTYYASSTAGELSTTVSSRRMGVAISTTSLWVDAGVPNYKSGDVIQRVVTPYDPTAKQSLTTAHADITGSSINFTPASADSQITYRFAFQLSADDAADAIHAHFKLVNNTVDVTESLTTYQIGDATNANGNEAFVTFEYTLDSWGTTQQELKLQGREYDASNDTKVHETLTWDGASSAQLRRAFLTVEETL